MRNQLYRLYFLFAFVISAQFLNAQNCIMNCKDTAIINLNSKCERLVTTDDIYVNPLDCPGLGEVHIYDFLGNDIGNKIDNKYLDSILLVKVLGSPGIGYTCQSKLWFKDLTGPEIIINDVSISCWDADKKFVINYLPTIKDNCSSVLNHTFNEKYYPFNCNDEGFLNYFQASRWDQNTGCKGDGKIDLTLMPDSISLYGSNNSVDSIKSYCSTSISIKIPADGAISFNWKLKGNGDMKNEFLEVDINGKKIKLSGVDTLSGKFDIQSLKKGDYFSINLYSDGDIKNMAAVINRFKYQTAAKGVFVVTWKAIDGRGNISLKDQNILVESLDLKSVLFPPDNVSSSIVECGKPYTPEYTGWPYVVNTSNPNLPVIQLITNNICVSVSYSDSIVKICEGSFKVYRNWIITGNCANYTLKHTQEIQVLDKTGPVITKPNDLVINTETGKCSASINLPLLKVLDICSPNNIKIDISTSFGAYGFGPFPDVPEGEHLIYFKATDNCGNSSQISSKLVVKDNAIPKALVKSSEVFYLDKQGKAVIEASKMDNGSSDNCCIQGFKIKRSNEPSSAYSDKLNLNCNDLNNSKININFKVTDCHGNYAENTAQVSVKDVIAPIIKCPADQTISCAMDIGNLDVFGKMTYTDNCNDQVLYSELKDIVACGKGTIKRTWQVNDISGNQAVCTQTLNLIYDQVWNKDGNKIIWPLDYTTTDCKSIDDLKPALLPAPNKQAVLYDINSCASLNVDFTDKLVSNSSKGCVTLERNWVITDYCQYEASQGKSGKWLHTQELQIIDKTAPVIVSPPDMTIANQNNKCYANINIPFFTATDCDPNLIYTNSVNSLGNNISGIYTVGSNLVTITATDHCGNSSSSIIKITVLDLDNPIAICKQTVSIDLAGANPSGEKSIDFELINNNSSDNCSSMNQLSYSVFPDKISCSDLGNKSVLLEVKDQSGNTSSCSTIITVTDNTGICAPDHYRISGHINSPANKAVEKADCQLYGPVSASDITGTDGTFKFDQLEKGKSFTVKPVKTLEPLNGVSTFDLILLNDHILGKKMLDSPYKYVAADVNNNKKVSTSDYVAIRDLILLNTDKFSKVDSWRFIPANYVFPSYQPQIPVFPEELIYNNLQQDILDANFIGIKMGDLNNSNNPTKLLETEIRSSEAMSLEIEDLELIKDEYFKIPVYGRSGSALAGYQFAFNFSKDYILQGAISFPFNTHLKPENIGNHIAAQQKLMLSWLNQDEDKCCNEEPLFYLEGIAGKNFKLSDLISLDLNDFKPEIYTQEREVGEISLKWITPYETLNPEIINSIHPNPFFNKLEIEINSIITEDIEITLSDVKGKELIIKNIEVKDLKKITLNDLEDFSDGIYMLKIKTGNSYSIKKLVKQTP